MYAVDVLAVCGRWGYLNYLAVRLTWDEILVLVFYAVAYRADQLMRLSMEQCFLSGVLGRPRP